MPNFTLYRHYTSAVLGVALGVVAEERVRVFGRLVGRYRCRQGEPGEAGE